MSQCACHKIAHVLIFLVDFGGHAVRSPSTIWALQHVRFFELYSEVQRYALVSCEFAATDHYRPLFRPLGGGCLTNADTGRPDLCLQQEVLQCKSSLFAMNTAVRKVWGEFGLFICSSMNSLGTQIWTFIKFAVHQGCGCKQNSFELQEITASRAVTLSCLQRQSSCLGQSPHLSFPLQHIYLWACASSGS